MSSIFRSIFTLEGINLFSKNTMVDHLGIVFTEIGDDYIKATMPVDSRTFQPLKLLHGGASVSLAETLGSVAATMTVDPETHYCVGQEINANHIKSAKHGFVEGITRPIHIGNRSQVWEIRITNEENQLVCISRITLAVIEKKN
ncbi:hotdog fold thioesterase [Reichenbachiella versicolor]|uniref:hotdog fold thioesterase n=1 Tax=Reichenbachiella versicolor TaxID=1821036 RepID=UPI000D6E136F|nr:hotdog fold thioesterase [Reichenbachiella versicolor]